MGSAVKRQRVGQLLPNALTRQSVSRSLALLPNQHGSQPTCRQLAHLCLCEWRRLLRRIQLVRHAGHSHDVSDELLQGLGAPLLGGPRRGQLGAQRGRLRLQGADLRLQALLDLGQALAVLLGGRDHLVNLLQARTHTTHARSLSPAG
jgi:hypothetical protein